MRTKIIWKLIGGVWTFRWMAIQNGFFSKSVWTIKMYAFSTVQTYAVANSW